MRRPLRPTRFRVQTSALAALSLGSLALFGLSPVAEAANKAKTAKTPSILHEILARLRPGGLERPRPTVKQQASTHQRHGSARARRRELAAARRRGVTNPADRTANQPPEVEAPSAPPAHVAMVQMLSPNTPAAPGPGRELSRVLPPANLAVRSLVPGGAVPPPPVAVRTNPEGGPPVANPTPVPEASRRPDPTRGSKEPSASATPASPPAVPATPTPPTGKLLADASGEVKEKFEIAQGLYTRHDAAGALRVLGEIEILQPNVVEVRNLRALVHYELAYRQYIQQDYAGALRELDEADEAQAVADTANLRGLVLARQRQYVPAEAAFRKAVAADPTLWAAKFNLADLPFSYRNFTEARQRFEALTAETDRATQPRQAELTEFKVFLTLLLEGRESAARSFLTRFKTDGTTPARIYGQAALDFHAGRSDRAIEAIKEARKKYPPQLEAIFAESFYRVGWLTDGMATGSGSPAVAAATPGPTPIPATTALADATPAPAELMPSPAAVAAPTPVPEPTPATVVASAPTPTPAPVVTTPTPAPVVAATTPPVLAATPAPTESARAVALATSTPVGTLAPTPALVPPVATRPASSKTIPTRSPAENFIRNALPWFVLLYLLAPWFYAVRVILNRRRSRSRARRVVPLARYPAADKVLEREKV